MTALPERGQLPLVAVLSQVPLLGEGVSASLRDLAEIRYVPPDRCDVLTLLRPIAERSEVTFTTHLEPSDRRVRADREQIEQVLFNIILNAIQASPRGETGASGIRRWK